MKWILIGSLLGSFVHSEHDSREACEGRAVMLREKAVVAKCVELSSGLSTTSIIPNGVLCLGPNGTYRNC